MPKPQAKLSKKDEKVLEKKIEKEVEKKLYKRLLAKAKSTAKSTAQHTKTKTVFIHNKFKDHASTAIIAAFGFLIALSWRDPIKAIVDDRVKLSTFESIPYAAEFLSAIIITIIAVFGIMLVAKWANKENKK
tara:strand:+ start:806 stop:1201 length:396 start_codon:yes stop_codon:yes gene_type:complete